MSFFDNLNLTLITNQSDKVLSHRAFKNISKFPYHTVHEYDIKLRDAILNIHLRLESGVSLVHIDTTNKDGSKNIYPEVSINNPLHCVEVIENIWKEICKRDIASLGKLDNVRHFDYLDWVFFLSHALRESEMEKGALFPHNLLIDWTHGVSLRSKQKFSCDQREAAKDVCKLLGQRNILDRYLSDFDKKTGVINDSIYLDARILIESNYDGITDYKNRRYL